MNKKYLAITVATLTALSVLAVGACDSGHGGGVSHWNPAVDGETMPNYGYSKIVEQEFKDAEAEPSSYFSLDRNTANYALVRAQINGGLKVAPDSVRIEELVNYFSYDYPAPEEDELSATGYLSDCPWNADHKLATFGIRTQMHKMQGNCNNYTFLIDVSGSMSATVRGTETSCLGLVQYGIGKLVENLGETDRVSVVTYASGTGIALEPTLATEEGKAEIMTAVNALQASGSTDGAGGLELAYEQAERYLAQGGNNRVILLTDGDFNVGIRNAASLKSFIRYKAESGVYLSVVGVGLGNTRDDLMEALALAGSGNYAYMDSPLEAEKILREELDGMLFTVAKDAKAGVTFNPDAVARYRILGYDTKLISKDEFNDPKKDAGELGSNLCVTVLYELELTESGKASGSAVLAEAEVRYKTVGDVAENKSVTAAVTTASGSGNDQIFASCVAEFGLILRNSQYRGDATLAAILTRLNALGAYLVQDAYKAEFRSIVQKAIASEQYGG